MLSAQHSKKIDVHLVHDLQQLNLNQRFREIDLCHETKNDSRDLQNRQQTNEYFLLRRLLRFEVFFKSDQFWSVKRDSLFYVVQIEFVHDRRSRHYNKKARQQRVLLWAVKTCELQLHYHIYRRQSRRDIRRQVRRNARQIVRQWFFNQQRNSEHITRAIKASEKAKRVTTCQNVERNEFNQARRKQEFVRIMHRDQTKSRIAQQFRDSRQALSESDMKRSRSIFRIQRQSQIFRDFFMRFY